MADRLTNIAFAWTIARRDGVTIGLVDHDRDIVLDGLRHRAAPGMTPSAIRRGDPLRAELMEVSGAITAAAIDADDLAAGRWDGAGVRVRAVDWDTGATIAELGRGTIGSVETAGPGFTAELRGPAAALDVPVAEETSPLCRAELGDTRCRVPMAGRTVIARVTAAAGETLTLDVSEASAGSRSGGTLRWLAGPNCGLTQAIAGSSGADVTLRWPPAFPVAPGTLAEVREGCDRTIETCARRFGNAENFRGEPYLPGIDLLTRYPGG